MINLERGIIIVMIVVSLLGFFSIVGIIEYIDMSGGVRCVMVDTGKSITKIIDDVKRGCEQE